MSIFASIQKLGSVSNSKSNNATNSFFISNEMSSNNISVLSTSTTTSHSSNITTPIGNLSSKTNNNTNIQI